jgi:hypothetical protein
VKRCRRSRQKNAPFKKFEDLREARAERLANVRSASMGSRFSWRVHGRDLGGMRFASHQRLQHRPPNRADEFNPLRAEGETLKSLP